MSPPHLQGGRAVAVASVGQPIALAIGVPMGAWLGTLADWRVVFAVMSVTALLLVAWILTVMPDFPGQQADRQLPVWKVLVLPGVRPILFVAFLWILAHNIVYTYLAAFLDRIGFGDRLGIVLFVFGLFAFVGIGVVGVFVDRALRSLTVLSLVVFAAALTALGVGGDSFAVIALSVAGVGRGIWRRSHSPSGGARGYDGRRCGHCAIGFRDDLQFGDRSGRRRRRADLGGQGCGSIAVGFAGADRRRCSCGQYPTIRTWLVIHFTHAEVIVGGCAGCWLVCRRGDARGGGGCELVR